MHRAALSFTVMLLRCACACAPGHGDEGRVTAHVTLERVVVANEVEGTVSCLDPLGTAPSRTLDLTHRGFAFMPHNVHVDATHHRAWVTAPAMHGDNPGAADELVEVDPGSCTVLRRFRIPGARMVAHVVVDADGTHAWLTGYASHDAWRVDLATGAVEQAAVFPTGSGPHGLRFCGNALLVALLDGHALAVVTPGNTQADVVPLGGMAVQVACAADGLTAYVTLFDARQVVRVDLPSRALQRLTLPGTALGPIQLELHPNGQRLYVADQGMLMGRDASTRVYVVDVPSFSVVELWEAGLGAHGVALDAAGDRVFVTGRGDDSLVVLSTSGGAELGRLSTGRQPNGVAWWRGMVPADAHAP